VENIIEELRQYKEGKHFLFFNDDNFAANPKHTKELLHAMIREEFTFKWSTQVRVEVAKDAELIKLMKQAGCHTVFIGFESVNPESLNEVNKNQKVEDIILAVRTLRKHGIHIHGMFILGLDHDNWKSMKQTVRFALKARLTSVQFLILTPFPGTELYKQNVSEKRIFFDDWSLYDGHHVVFKPVNFSMAELQSAQIYSHKKFYSNIERIRKLVKGNITGFVINFYAQHLNRIWKKKNKVFLKVLDLLKPYKNADIVIKYREKITLS
jgi:radical SAM superfamily enzyme YgiQ (UPF0313 family)